MELQHQGFVWPKLLLKKWDLWRDVRGSEVNVVNPEHLLHWVRGQVKLADWRLRELVHHASESRLGNNELRESIAVHEAHVVWVKVAGGRLESMITFFKTRVWLVNQLSKDVSINVSISNKWWSGVPEVKVENRLGGLPWEWWSQENSSLVMVECLVHDWSHHVWENVVSHEVHWVLNDDDSEVDELVHNEGNDFIVVIKIGLSKLDVAVIHDWIKVSIFVER